MQLDRAIQMLFFLKVTLPFLSDYVYLSKLICVHCVHSGACGDQKKASDYLGLEL